MNKVLALVEEGGQAVVKTVTVIGHTCTCVEKLLVDGQKLEPAAKAGLTKLVEDGEAIATAAVAAGLSKGANIMADEAVIAAVKTFVADFLVVAPVLKQAADIIASDAAKVA